MSFLRQNQFTVGDVFLRDEESFRIDSLQLSANHMTLIGTSGEVIDLSIDEFRNGIATAEFKRPSLPISLSSRDEHTPPPGFDEEQLRDYASRLALVRTIEGYRRRKTPWKAIFTTIRKEGVEVDGEKQECTLSERRVKQIYGDWLKFGDAGLRSSVHRRGNRRKRHDSIYERIANEVIDNLFVKNENICLKHVVEGASKTYKDECKAKGLTPGPCGRKSFESVLAQRSNFEVLSQRFDPKTARRLTRAAIRQFADCNPLDRVEIDCTPTDIFVLDTEGNVIGRATVCAAIDAATGVILAANVTMAGANQYLVLRTLKDAMLPRDETYFEKHDIKSRFNPFGLVAEVDCDRGVENAATLVENFLLQLGMLDPSHVPGQPQKRPHIERSWRTSNEFLKQFPGGVNQRLADDEEHTRRAMKRASLTFSEVETLVHKFVHDVYHEMPLERLSKRFGMPTTPAQAWEKLRHTVECLEPPTEEVLRTASLLYGNDRTLQHYGIHVLGEKYHCEELAELFRIHADGLKVDVYIDPTDMRTVEVLSKDRRTRCTARTRWDMPTLNLDQFKAFCNRIKPSHTDRDKVTLARYELVSKAHSEVEARQPTRKKRKVAAVREEAIDTIERSQFPPASHVPLPKTPAPGPGKFMRPGEVEE